MSRVVCLSQETASLSTPTIKDEPTLQGSVRDLSNPVRLSCYTGDEENAVSYQWFDLREFNSAVQPARFETESFLGT